MDSWWSLEGNKKETSLKSAVCLHILLTLITTACTQLSFECFCPYLLQTIQSFDVWINLMWLPRLSETQDSNRGLQEPLMRLNDWVKGADTEVNVHSNHTGDGSSFNPSLVKTVYAHWLQLLCGFHTLSTQSAQHQTRKYVMYHVLAWQSLVAHGLQRLLTSLMPDLAAWSTQTITYQYKMQQP